MSLRTIKNVAIGVGVTGIVAYLLGFFKAKNNNDSENQEEIQDELNTDNLSYAQTWYTNAATLLREAMDRQGTDESAVLGVLSLLKNKDDWNQLYLKFGNYLPSPWSWNAGQLDTGDLTEWLIEEHDSAELKTIRAILLKIQVTI